MRTIAFFNNKGGVGKTTLAYHCAHMLAEKGYRCLAADLDPQANLTSMSLPEEKLESMYERENDRETLNTGLKPLDKGIGDIDRVPIHHVAERLGLLAGDLDLSLFEDKLSYHWGKCNDGDEASFRITSAIHRILQREAIEYQADFCLVDVGPNLGSLNRATLIACDQVVVPMGADLFSLQGLKNLGERLERWRREWQARRGSFTPSDFSLPEKDFRPMGYVLMQQGMKESRPVKSYRRWADRIPEVFRRNVLHSTEPSSEDIEHDHHCLAMIRHYHSLAPMAMEARKPIFNLKPADGAIGAHYQSVRSAYEVFERLVERLVAHSIP